MSPSVARVDLLHINSNSESQLNQSGRPSAYEGGPLRILENWELSCCYLALSTYVTTRSCALWIAKLEAACLSSKILW